MSNDVLVIGEHRDGALKGISKEAMTAARSVANDLGGQVVSVLLGDDTAGMADDLAGCGGAKMLRVHDAKLAQYTPEAYVGSLKQVIADVQPKVVLVGHSYQAIDFFPRLAAAHDGALVPDVTGIAVESGKPVFIRKVINGKLDARTVPAGDDMIFCSVQQGAFPVQPADGPASIEDFSVDLTDVTTRNVVEVKAAEAGEVDLTAADIIVAGGRGVGDPDKFEVVFDLAEALGGAVGASRPPCDSEWVEHERQIGSSGQVVAPKLYIALGISGAIQHLVGMRGAGCVVAINKDPNAAIFQEAAYGIVGDLHEVVPALIEAVNEAKN
ncbi:MAG TPA: electron transfer flavoprotein subunit alpha/FixB family protein [Candidatus Krumholzibacteria bacterium]|nr:electron transfer flavoprotein subunit alpha/FixB family protein [Candidatus Krumholzibacteria bacterium]